MNVPESLTAEDRQNLVAYLDGELDDETARSLEAKLQRSPTARLEAETLQRTWELLDYLPRPKAPESFTRATLTRLEKGRATQAASQRRWRWAAALAWLGSLAAASVLGFFVTYRPPDPLPPEPTAEELQLLGRQHYWEYYEHVDDVAFLRELSSSDLFGSEP